MSSRRCTTAAARRSAWVAVALLAPLTARGQSADQGDDPTPHSDAQLLSEVRSIRPGEPFMVALQLTLDPGWHSYWQNPGDAGQPIAIDWKLKPAFRAGEIQWPYPDRIEVSSLVSYGYHDEVLLMTEITPPKYMSPGYPVTLAAEAHWLVCREICLPAEADLELELLVRDEAPTRDFRWRAAFAEARARLPAAAGSWPVAAWNTRDGYVLEVIPDSVSAASLRGAHFFASERGVISHGAPQDCRVDGDVLRLSLRKSPYGAGDGERLRGVLVLPRRVQMAAGEFRALAVDVEVMDAPVPRVENTSQFTSHTEGP